MTDWWRIIISNILPLPECILDYSFKLTLNHQGPYNSKRNRYYGKLIMNACITRETFVFTVFRRVFHSTLKLELCRHACRCPDPIISTCRYGKNMPTTALTITFILKHYKVYYWIMHLNFFKDFNRKYHALSLNILSWSHWGPQLQSMKSPLSPCDNTRVAGV